ncbi:sulfurtransferase [Okeania sp. SIO2B3]|uniref:sulfurtransferase n=1 Tax=Okeania sp. SIO2B3 TaxID=2607784 RepID=UPI0025D137D0|nr:rhodanese-like domain-containing protein [Okeania sp. SIO2B3]
MFNPLNLSTVKIIALIGLMIFGLISTLAISSFLKTTNIIKNQSIDSQFVINESPQQIIKNQWIISSTQARELVAQGATILDARSCKILNPQSLLNATCISWQEFSQSQSPFKGKLLTDDKILTEKLQAIGIFNHQPVVVFGNTINGWGEDGRIVWMLRTLGHQKSFLVDGGFTALVKGGFPTVKFTKNNSPPRGDFVVNRNENWHISQNELKTSLGKDNLVIIDTREPQEYAGKTPYGEQRGGHIPGAIHIYFKYWLDNNGMLLSRDKILEMLTEKGITKDKVIVTYCTGGVRSAWSTSVLIYLGFKVKNYSGSMWEWSASSANIYPLEISRKEGIGE